MGFERISEVLKEPMAEVRNDGSLLGIAQYPGETDDTYRDRVAYGMQAKLIRATGREVSARILERMEALEVTAQSQGAEVAV